MKVSLIALAVFLCLPFSAQAASKSLCPDKTLETNTVEGMYTGTECGDMCHGSIVLDTGEEFSFILDEEEAEEAFGAGTGQRVSVTYEVQQFWNEAANECSRLEVFASGKMLAPATEQGKIPASPQAAANPKVQSPPAPTKPSATCPYRLEWEMRRSKAGPYFVFAVTSTVDELIVNNLVVDRGNNVVFNDFSEVSALVFGREMPKVVYPKKLKFSQRFLFVVVQKPIELVFHTNHGVWTTKID